MTGLLDEVLAAHGGIERWRAARAVRAHLDMTGPTRAGLGQEKAFVDVGIEVDLRHQRTEFTGFTGPGRRGIFTPDRVTIEDEDGTVLQERHAPRESYPPRGPDTRWDPLHALYFGEDGLQRRVDYAPELLGGWPVAHCTEAHRTVSGLVFPTHRYVLPS